MFHVCHCNCVTERHVSDQVSLAPGSLREQSGHWMIRRYSGDKKSIEARSANNGKTWSVKLFDNGRLTEYSNGTLAEVDTLASTHQMKLVP